MCYDMLSNAITLTHTCYSPLSLALQDVGGRCNAAARPYKRDKLYGSAAILQRYNRDAIDDRDTLSWKVHEIAGTELVSERAM